MVDLSDQIGSIQELIDGGPELLLSVHDALDKAHSQISLTQVTLLAPILNLPRIFALGWLIEIMPSKRIRRYPRFLQFS